MHDLQLYIRYLQEKMKRKLGKVCIWTDHVTYAHFTPLNSDLTLTHITKFSVNTIQQKFPKFQFTAATHPPPVRPHASARPLNFSSYCSGLPTLPARLGQHWLSLPPTLRIIWDIIVTGDKYYTRVNNINENLGTDLLIMFYFLLVSLYFIICHLSDLFGSLVNN